MKTLELLGTPPFIHIPLAKISLFFCGASSNVVRKLQLRKKKKTNNPHLKVPSRNSSCRVLLLLQTATCIVYQHHKSVLGVYRDTCIVQLVWAHLSDKLPEQCCEKEHQSSKSFALPQKLVPDLGKKCNSLGLDLLEKLVKVLPATHRPWKHSIVAYESGRHDVTFSFSTRVSFSVVNHAKTGHPRKKKKEINLLQHQGQIQ